MKNWTFNQNNMKSYFQKIKVIKQILEKVNKVPYIEEENILNR